jgi:hypothetical protein
MTAKKSGKTSVDKGHSHSYNLDAKGNGKTSVNNEHFHSIANYSVSRTHGHGHVLEQSVKKLKRSKNGRK